MPRSSLCSSSSASRSPSSGSSSTTTATLSSRSANRFGSDAGADAEYRHVLGRIRLILQLHLIALAPCGATVGEREQLGRHRRRIDQAELFGAEEWDARF